MSIIEIKDINEFYNITKGKEIMREQAKGEELVREFIRKNLPSVIARAKKSKNNQLNEEKQLREIVRHMLLERDISDTYPHASTGINTLEDVLKKMITTLRSDYKRLTTDKEQRESYRAHLLNAVELSLRPSDANEMSDSPDTSLLSTPDVPEEVPTAEEPAFTMDDLDEDLGIDIVDDKEKMIPVEDDDEPDEFEEFTSNVSGDLDRTGARAAYDTHKKVGQYILDGYEKLDNPSDREDFSDYLITNLKLYLDKFEAELSTELDEPTTLEYEKITGRK
tara:strand:- start:288 stop:1124 length:837 start_codon:yes stop_codon:yes gene_type:complete